MNKTEVMLKLIEIAAGIVSPTVHDREGNVAEVAKRWYKDCIDDTLAMGVEPKSGQEEPVKRRGRRPKTVEEPQ